MPVFRFVLLVAAIATVLSGARTLEILTIDVEGGKCLLVVSPSGESLLVDLGWPESPTRPGSTKQIIKALEAAEVKQIDYLVISHYDIDHAGDIARFVSRFAVRRILDHGDLATSSAGDPRYRQTLESIFRAYVPVGDKIGRTRLRPGDGIPIKGLEVRVIASAGELIREPLASAGAANPVCVTAKQPARIERDIEDDQSVGVLYSYGGFRMFDPADLEGHLTHALACPNNLIGTVDVYHLNVHGQFKGLAEAAVGALRPQVILLGNGARKGGDRDTWPVLRQAAPAADIWQVHFSENAGSDRNPSENFIANPQGNDGCHGIRISVEPGGKTFTVINERNGYRKTYTTARQSAK